MGQTITAIYENGVLRPLTLLALPGHTEVEISIRLLPYAAAAEAYRRRVRKVLIAAGLVLPEPDTPPFVQPLSEAEWHELACRIPAGRPLSGITIEEREGR